KYARKMHDSCGAFAQFVGMLRDDLRFRATRVRDLMPRAGSMRIKNRVPIFHSARGLSSCNRLGSTHLHNVVRQIAAAVGEVGVDSLSTEIVAGAGNVPALAGSIQ